MSSLPPNPNDALRFDPTDLKTVYLAGGCFWGVEAFIARIPGVAETQCGYANGETENPTYRQVCQEDTGHAETVRVCYDPSRLDLKTLIRRFFSIIDPTARNRQGHDIGRQYRSGIYYSDPLDLIPIFEALEEEKQKHLRPVVTEVLPLLHFYPAEEYHQHYLEKNPDGYCHVNLGLLR